MMQNHALSSCSPNKLQKLNASPPINWSRKREKSLTASHLVDGTFCRAISQPSLINGLTKRWFWLQAWKDESVSKAIPLAVFIRSASGFFWARAKRENLSTVIITIMVKSNICSTYQPDHCPRLSTFRKYIITMHVFLTKVKLLSHPEWLSGAISYQVTWHNFVKLLQTRKFPYVGNFFTPKNLDLKIHQSSAQKSKRESLSNIYDGQMGTPWPTIDPQPLCWNNWMIMEQPFWLG